MDLAYIIRTWLRLLFKYIMSLTRNLLSCLKSDRTIKLCRGNSHVSTKKDSECCGTPAISIQSFVKAFVKNNLKSVTTQIIKTKNSSNDISKVEQGLQKVKYVKKKHPKSTDRAKDDSSLLSHETLEDSPRNDFAHKRQKAPRANYFIAIQVNDSRVLENAKKVQDRILENSVTSLQHMTVDVRKSHITLMAMYLPDSSVVNIAKQCLDQCLHNMTGSTDFVPPDLEFEGLNVFSGGSVLFITVKPSPGLQSLISMADVIKKQMKQHGIVGAGKDFNPHMTLLKYRWKKQTQNFAKKVQKAAYKMFEKENFGSQTIPSIQLCKMEGVREDGYYIVEHEVFFHS